MVKSAMMLSRWVFAAIVLMVASTTACGRSKRMKDGAEGGASDGTGGEPETTGGSAGRTGGESGAATTGGRGGTEGVGGSSSGRGGEAGMGGSGGTAGIGDTGGTGGIGEELPFELDLDVVHWVGDDLNDARTFVRLNAWREDCADCRARANGVCQRYSDDGAEECVCDPRAGACLERFAVERDSAVVDEVEVVDGQAGLFFLDLFETQGNTIVVEGCGTRVDFPLDTSVAPLPTVLETTLGESDGGEAPFRIRWSSEPASALAYISAGDAYGGLTCMFTGEEAAFTIPVETCPYYELSTYALVAETTTALGPTRFIVGQRVYGEIANDFAWCP